MEAGLVGQLREQGTEPALGDREDSLSEEIPITAWATQRVATSASFRLRRAFLLPSGRRSSAVQNTAVSSRSRSASIVALLGSKVRLDTADFDLLSPVSSRPRYCGGVESII